jgi:tetratricopeptide (TPR) repeat protein
MRHRRQQAAAAGVRAKRTRSVPESDGSWVGLDLPVGIVLAVTLLIKVTVALQLAAHPLLQPMGALDTAFYVEAAKRVAGGDFLSGKEAFYASPLYIYFLAAVFAAAGPSLLAARLVQAVLGTAGVGLAMATARRWYDRRSALAAGALLAASGILTFFEIVILQSALDPFLMALDGCLVARAFRKDTVSAWMLAGAGLGLHALNRPNLLLCAAVLAVLAGAFKWRQVARLRPAMLVAAGTILGAALAIVPVTLRNFAVSGELILITSHGGLNFYIGNHADADGAYRPVGGITSSIAGQASDARGLVSKALGRKATDQEVSSYFYRRAVDWIAANPVAAAKLAGRKVVLLMNAASPSLNYSYAFYRREESTLLKVLFVGPWLLIPLGLTGCLVSSRRDSDPGMVTWAAVAAAYAASLILFFVTDRYQLPLLVPLAIAGGRAVSYVWIHRREPARLAMPAAGLVVFSVITNVGLGARYDQTSEERARLAIALIGQGDSARAESLLARTEKEHADPGLVQYRAGLAYANQRQFGPAAAHLRRALEIRPNLFEAELLLGQVLLDEGEATEAVTYLSRAVNRNEVLENLGGADLARSLVKAGRGGEASALLEKMKLPADATPDTLVALGSLAIELHHPGDAVRFLAAAAAKSPDNPDVIERLAVARGMSGDLPGATGTLENAIRFSSQTPSLHLNLAVTYAQAGRLGDARREAQEALRIRPDYPQARALLARLMQTH